MTLRLRHPGTFILGPLRWGCSVTAGDKLVDSSDCVVGDAAEHIGKPGLRIDGKRKLLPTKTAQNGVEKPELSSRSELRSSQIEQH